MIRRLKTNLMLGAAACAALWSLPALAACLPADAGKVMKPVNPSGVMAGMGLRPDPVAVGKPFVVDLRVCTETGNAIERLTVNATMPAHRHGMNYKPEIVTIGDGRYEGRGFLFHMPGLWEIELTVYSGGKPSRLKLDVEAR
jgi:hypothetical protein